jgi:hypothetical protein
VILQFTTSKGMELRDFNSVASFSQTGAEATTVNLLAIGSVGKVLRIETGITIGVGSSSTVGTLVMIGSPFHWDPSTPPPQST